MTDETTATERLRELLDERGRKYTTESVGQGTLFTVWADDERAYYVLVRHVGIDIWSNHITPEQAVEATLGRGTCRNISPKLGNDEFTCEECLARVYGSGGRWFDANWEYHKFNYCPNCGRKVE